MEEWFWILAVTQQSKLTVLLKMEHLVEQWFLPERAQAVTKQLNYAMVEIAGLAKESTKLLQMSTVQSQMLSLEWMLATKV
jgi:hypothetical protein